MKRHDLRQSSASHAEQPQGHKRVVRRAGKPHGWSSVHDLVLGHLSTGWVSLGIIRTRIGLASTEATLDDLVAWGRADRLSKETGCGPLIAQRLSFRLGTGLSVREGFGKSHAGRVEASNR